MGEKRLQANSKGFMTIVFVLLVVAVGVTAILFTLINHKTGSNLQIKNGCKDTDVTVQPLTIAALNSPIALHAKLTMGSQPVVNERITFRAIAKDGGQRNLQLLMGYATTDASGVGILKQSDGFASQAITLGKSGTVSGYEAKFDGNNITDNNSRPFYCGSYATAKVSIQ